MPDLELTKEDQGTTTDVAQQSNGLFNIVPGGASLEDFPSDDNTITVPYDLNIEYWTPEAEGETKMVVFEGVTTQQMPSQQDPNEMDTIEVATFLAKENGAITRMGNASKRLVSILKNAEVPNRAAIVITYKGKKKNATNGFSSDTWSVQPLQMK